jgi:predicted lipoprotein with Yx(FWY)xxD motif
MTDSVRPAGGPSGLRWISRVTLAIMLAGTTAVATVGVAAAQTGSAAPAHASKAAKVVLQRHRAPFGKILVTPKGGKALYFKPHGRCGPACVAIWPRLVMPKGRTIPTGARCLGTAKFGTHHRLQVTYHGKRLYTFVSDMGHQVSGNGFQGFKVAKVVACPMM